MMLPLIGLMALMIFVCRLSGFVLPVRGLSPFWNQVIQFVPLSIFTALVISALYKDTTHMDFKLLALGTAGLVVWRTRRLDVSVMSGLCLLWLFIRLSS